MAEKARIIYGIQSPYVVRVRASMIFKGLDFKHVSVNLGRPTEEWLRLTAVGKIPVFQDEDGTVVWDSSHILDYLDLKYPDYPMLGSGPKQKALVWNIIALANRMVEFNTPIFVERANVAEKFKASGNSHKSFVYDDQQKADLKKEVSLRIDNAYKLLGDRVFYTDKFSAADIAMLTSLRQAHEYVGCELGPMKHYYETHMDDEKVKQVFDVKSVEPMKEI